MQPKLDSSKADQACVIGSVIFLPATINGLISHTYTKYASFLNNLIEINIARQGKAYQSSLIRNFGPDKAIDGKKDGRWYSGSCSVTKRLPQPWWRLDLLKPYKVHVVKITNPVGSKYKTNKGAQIHIGYSLKNKGNSNPR